MSNKANDTIHHIYKLTVYSTDVKELKKLVNNLDKSNHSQEITKEIVTESFLLEKLAEKDTRKPDTTDF